MPETLILEDKPTQERLASEAPDVHEALKHLPPHIIERVGSLALKLTHLDMHPKVEKEFQDGKHIVVDYDRTIFDADNPELEFEQQSIEAARSGQEKLAEILHLSSATLALAHAALVAKGYSFEAPPNEGEAERKERHSRELKAITDTAYKMAADRAIELKSSGNQEELATQLESIFAIMHITGDKYGGKSSNRASRRLIHEGLAQDMIIALQESSKLKSGAYDSVGSDSGQRKLLELASGKNLDFGYKETGDIDLSKLESFFGPEGFFGVIAIITSSKINLPEEYRRALLDKVSNFTTQKPLKAKLDSYSSYSDAEEYFKIVERCDSESDWGIQTLEAVVLLDDPLILTQYADSLGLSLAETVQILAPYSSEQNKKIFDIDAADNLVQISNRHPELFLSIKESAKVRSFNKGLGAILESADKLKDAGVTNNQFYEALIGENPESIKELANTIIYVLSYINKKGLTESEFIEKISDVSSIAATLLNLMMISKDLSENNSSMSKEQIDQIIDLNIEDLFLESSISKAYKGLYEKVHYPAPPSSIKNLRLDLGHFPDIASELQDLGIDNVTANAIFNSWATYNALLKHGYSNSDGFRTIDKMPEEGSMKSIIRDQTWALRGQLNAIKKYHSEYGPDELKEIISTFGIYNFNRHHREFLHDQLERWKSGQSVENVVADARADWNSYTGKPVFFEDESERPGTFYFEVNSPVELSRLAVKIGQRERQNGREPNVKRFIVHAHGNPSGLLLGVNGEYLETINYVNAAKNRSKISGAESNNYKRHLGDDYEIILQSCSGAGETSGKNIAQAMADALSSPVTGAVDTITGLKISSDGTVVYQSGPKEGVEAITY